MFRGGQRPLFCGPCFDVGEGPCIVEGKGPCIVESKGPCCVEGKGPCFVESKGPCFAAGLYCGGQRPVSCARARLCFACRLAARVAPRVAPLDSWHSVPPWNAVPWHSCAFPGIPRHSPAFPVIPRHSPSFPGIPVHSPCIPLHSPAFQGRMLPSKRPPFGHRHTHTQANRPPGSRIPIARPVRTGPSIDNRLPGFLAGFIPDSIPGRIHPGIRPGIRPGIWAGSRLPGIRFESLGGRSSIP